MLADPIDVGTYFRTYCDVLSPYIGQTILVLTSGTLAFEVIDERCILLNSGLKWCIINAEPSICFKSAAENYEKQCTMIELLDWMKDAHPDCFEWLLFHPEWLQ